jgi:hypothetical protein
LLLLSGVGVAVGTSYVPGVPIIAGVPSDRTSWCCWCPCCYWPPCC